MDCIRSDLGPMTVGGSGPASPDMIARSTALAPARRQQDPVTVVTSTRLAHGPVVDSDYSLVAVGMLERSQNPAQPLFDQLHQIDLVPMTVVGSGQASPGMIARSKA